MLSKEVKEFKRIFSLEYINKIHEELKIHNMNKTVNMNQELEFIVPDFPKWVTTTTSTGTINIELISEKNLIGIFDQIKENALEYRRSKIELTKEKVTGSLVTGMKTPGAGKKLVDHIG